jgi:hypothetical protein
MAMAYGGMSRGTGKRKPSPVSPASSKKGNPILGPPLPGNKKKFNKIRDKQVASLPSRRRGSGGPVRPDSPKSGIRRPGGSGGSGGSGGGGGGGAGGGGGGAAGRGPKRTPKKPSKASKAPQLAAPGPPGEDPDKKMWEELFGPARREIERQKSLLEQKKAADTAAWDKYNTWAEDQRAKTAGLLTTAQKDQATAYSASKAASDANIKGYVDAARGGSGAPPLGGDMAQATGANVTAEQAAATQASQGMRGDYNTTMAAIANQRVADQANINKAVAQEGTANLTGQYTKASNALASKAADIETAFQQAKLDKVYRDRQYGLDRETLDWTKSLQGGQLALEQQKVLLSAQASELKAQMDANEFNSQQRQQTIQNALAAQRISQDDARLLQSTVTAGNTQSNTNIGRGQKLLDWVDKTYPDFGDGMDTHKQGQAIIKSIARARAQGLSASLAWQTLEAAFGSRFTHPSVFKHFKARYPKYKRR